MNTLQVRFNPAWNTAVESSLLQRTEVPSTVKSSGRVAATDIFHILVVDDSAELRSVLSEVLHFQGFTVDLAESADAALITLKERVPDAIICDIMMPETDGIALHEELKSHPEWCHIPFLFLTALSEPDDIRAGKKTGCDEYLTKPFCLDDLEAVIRGKIQLSRSRKAKSTEQFERYRKKIIHTLSHEFRTPLVAINTGAELLLDRANEENNPAIDHQFVKLLETVHRGGLRLQRLVEDFMSLQQIESGSAAKVAVKLKERLSLRDIAQDALELYTDTVQDSSLLVEFNDAQASTRILVDVYGAQIQNIIFRLLDNAHKFAGKGIPATVSIRTTDHSASVVIRDRGPGLPEGLINNACELFVQLDRDKLEQQGCGVGLTIASHYANFNNGKLLFHSPLDGRGLEVELKLPRF